MMSRNKLEGRYAGKLQSKHYRTRGVNNTVSTLDCVLEVEFKKIRQGARMFNEVAKMLNWPLRASRDGFAWGL